MTRAERPPRRGLALTNAGPTQDKTPAPTSGGKGIVYLTSSGDPYRAPKITSYKLKQYSKNFYGAGVARKLLALIFSTINIQVTDKAGEQAPDIEEEIENMVTAQDVALFSKMKIGWMDTFWQGMAFFDPIWEQEGPRWILKELHRLPPESFSQAAQALGLTQTGTQAIVPGAILKGVVAMPDGTIRFFQSTNASGQQELTGLYILKNSSSPEVAGEPEILPVTPVLTMLDFAWKAQMQKTNRVGAPILILQIENAKGDDYEYGEKLLKNWGKDTGFILRSNMKLADFTFRDTAAALETINTLTDMSLDYWVPTSMLSKAGQLIGGNSNSDLRLIYSFISGIHRELEAQWEPLLQIYLDSNGYEGHRVKITIEDPEIDISELALEQAKVGADTGLLDDNEIRERLGAKELSEAELAKLKGNNKPKPPILPPGLQPGQPGGPHGDANADPEANIPPQEKIGPDGAPGPGGKGTWKEAKPGTPGAKTDPKTGKLYELTNTAPGNWPNEPRKADPDKIEEALANKEEKEIQAALDTLSRQVIAQL